MNSIQIEVFWDEDTAWDWVTSVYNRYYYSRDNYDTVLKVEQLANGSYRASITTEAKQMELPFD